MQIILSSSCRRRLEFPQAMVVISYQITTIKFNSCKKNKNYKSTKYYHDSELRQRPGDSEVDNASWDCFLGTDSYIQLQPVITQSLEQRRFYFLGPLIRQTFVRQKHDVVSRSDEGSSSERNMASFLDLAKDLRQIQKRRHVSV